MSRGRPVASIVLNDDERLQLVRFAQSRALPHGLVRRAQIVLACADGEPNNAIAKRLKLNKATVGKWRQRYRDLGIEGLHEELRAGGPDREVSRTSAWRRSSTRHCRRARRAASTGAHARWPSLFGVQPHRSRSFKLSNDPFFIEKVRDIVGLYLNPPDHAMVLCVDEKSQIQALNRNADLLMNTKYKDIPQSRMARILRGLRVR